MKIEVKNLKKSFNENLILKNISLTIERNKSTVILGQSGCGKSVLIKTIYQLFSYQGRRDHRPDQALAPMLFVIFIEGN